MKDADRCRAAIRQNTFSGGDLLNGKILIVEDNREISALLSDFLTKNGYETITAFDGSSACAVMKKQEFDIVLWTLCSRLSAASSL